MRGEWSKETVVNPQFLLGVRPRDTSNGKLFQCNNSFSRNMICNLLCIGRGDGYNNELSDPLFRKRAMGP